MQLPALSSIQGEAESAPEAPRELLDPDYELPPEYDEHFAPEWEAEEISDAELDTLAELEALAEFEDFDERL